MWLYIFCWCSLDKSIPNVLPRTYHRGQEYCVQDFNCFSYLYFGRKAVCLRKDSWEAWQGMKFCIGSPSQVEERLGWTPSATGLFTATAVPMALLSVMSRLLPTISVTKISKKKLIWGTFPGEMGYVCSWWKLFTLHQCSLVPGMEEENVRDNSWPVLFSNSKALS